MGVGQGIDGFVQQTDLKLEPRRVKCFVGATETTIYVAIQSQLPDEGDLLTISNADSLKVVYDDSLEVYVCPTPDSSDKVDYQFIANSADRCGYNIHISGNAQEEPSWKGNWKHASGLHDGWWHFECAIPIESMSTVNNPNHIFLVGNHEQHYAYSYRTFQCSGYEQWKYFLINDIVPRSVWDKLKWFYFLDGQWLLSHGGLHTLNVPDDIKKVRKDRQQFIAALTKYLDDELRKGFQSGANNQGCWVFNAGRARWGQQRVGGLTWCDFEREFKPFRGINQIVGHTPQMQSPRWCILEKDPLNTDGRVVYRPYELFKPSLAGLNNLELSHNICLDVHGNMHWATWNGKELKLGNYSDL